MRRNTFLLPLLMATFVSLVFSCAQLPENVGRKQSHAITDGEDTRLGRMSMGLLEGHGGQSGGILLKGGLDAFVGRAVLVKLAERSIDVQYYMYHQDTVGKLLLLNLVEAAERGVRVRMLIDDMYGEEADDVWAAIDSQPNMEVRLFNPFVRGSSKLLQFLTRLSEVNYRMHSKSFTVDNQVTIVGGRNIGDEYFDANPDLAFADLDLLAIGPVVPEVSDAFDQYWNSSHAYPATLLAGKQEPDRIENLRDQLERFPNQEEAARYMEALNNSPLAHELRAGTLSFHLGEAQVIHDSSEKKEKGEDWRKDLLISKLWPHMQAAEKELLIVSPYFVPGEMGAEALCELSRKGISIQILTNSLASNDVSAVHAGYAKYRKQLLKAGVQLYELDEKIKDEMVKKLSWLPGLSKSSLHAKTMVIDGKKMFIGSMNFDLRSLHLNNEIGILFQNKTVAGNSAASFKQNIEQVAFKVTLDENGSMRWSKKQDGETMIFTDEPYVGFWTKAMVWFVGILPVESML